MNGSFKFYLLELIALVTLGISSLAFGSSEVFYSGIINSAVSKFLQLSCERDLENLLISNGGKITNKSCKKAAEVFISIIDSSVNPLLVFKSDIEKSANLGSGPTTDIHFIKTLRDEVIFNNMVHKPINFWELSNQFSNSTQQALDRMALYLQCPFTYSFAKLDRESLNPQMFSLINELRTLYLNSFDGIYSPFTNVNGYEVNSYKLYHFFVPARLTQKLLAKGIDPLLAVYMPFMFNWYYEILRDPQFNLLFDVNELYYRLRPFTVDTTQDVFAAFAGAFMGLDPSMDLSFLEKMKNKNLEPQSPYLLRIQMLRKISNYIEKN